MKIKLLVIREKREGKWGDSEEVRPGCWRLEEQSRLEGNKKSKQTQHKTEMGMKGESGQI